MGALALACWAGVLLHPARPWDLRPIDAEDPPAADPEQWPSVGVVIPARNEAEMIGPTVGALDQQDYPGPMRIVVVDDRSSDATGDVARAMARVASEGRELARRRWSNGKPRIAAASKCRRKPSTTETRRCSGGRTRMPPIGRSAAR